MHVAPVPQKPATPQPEPTAQWARELLTDALIARVATSPKTLASACGGGITVKQAYSLATVAHEFKTNKKSDKALPILVGILDFNPKDPFMWSFRGALELDLELDDEAILSFSESLRLDPKAENSAAYYNRGRLSMRRGLRDFRKALKDSPLHPETRSFIEAFKVALDAFVAEKSAVELQAKAERCVHCGASVEANCKFCGSCGERRSTGA